VCVVLLGELPGGKLYSSRELGILRSLLREAKLLYENAWLYDENLRQCRLILEEEKRHLSEKETIIRDLHDGLGGITTNISLLSEVAGKSSSVSTMKSSLATIAELSREGLAEIRAFMHSLEHESLTWPGLVSDLKSFGSKIIESNGMGFKLESTLEKTPGRPGSLLFLNLFRIYREALTNIVKHSGAARVRVRLEIGPERIVLAVEDDGAGFVAGRVRKGRGLAHMEKRVRGIGGTLSVQSAQGTRVHLEVLREIASVPQNYPAPGIER
jgi:signal transduction histidine kinase